MRKHLKDNVFPFFATLGAAINVEDEDEQEGKKGSKNKKNTVNKKNKALESYAHIAEYMQDADLEIKNESVLTEAVTMVDSLPLTQTDVKGDIYNTY